MKNEEYKFIGFYRFLVAVIYSGTGNIENSTTIYIGDIVESTTDTIQPPLQDEVRFGNYMSQESYDICEHLGFYVYVEYGEEIMCFPLLDITGSSMWKVIDNIHSI